MICKNFTSNERYNYSFVENGEVLLENLNESFRVKYEDWCQDYLILDKWNSLKIEK